MPITLDHLRRFTVTRNFSQPTSLKRALQRMGFVQADPIRAPARAQDLILRLRVNEYRAGDLERRYARLDLEEDFFVIYGFVTRPVHALMHPRIAADDRDWPWPIAKRRRARQLLDFVSVRGMVHPREVAERFDHGKVTNYWGGSSNATTHLLDEMHYQGLLRVAGREKGIRLYSVKTTDRTRGTAGEDGPSFELPQSVSARVDALVDLLVRLYAPLPGTSLSSLVGRLRYAVPQWQAELRAALERAKDRLIHARVEGVDWYWAQGEKLRAGVEDRVRLLAPFDPVVRDRVRFQMLWDWEYRFEAYTPVAKRKLGYYALPVLWRDRVIGWANLSIKYGELASEFGYAEARPRERAFKLELEAELERVRSFLRLESSCGH